METVAEVNDWLADYSFQEWELVCREPHLPRNQGCGTVLRMIHRDLVDCDRDGRTFFDMEIPIVLPVTQGAALSKLWQLIQFTAMHEAAEWFWRSGTKVYDPHQPVTEPVIFGKPTIVWSESDA